MHKKEFVAHQLAKRGRKFDPQDKHPEIKSDDSDSEIDESMLSDSYYPEVSDFLPDNSKKEKKPKGTDEEIQKKKSKIRVDREDEFIHKYKTFMGLVEENHSYEWKFLLDDLILLINLLCSKWLWKYSQRKKSVGYQRGDDQEARDVASLAVYKELLAQYESGSYEQYSSNDYRHALAYFQCLFHRRVIDVYRTLYGRMPDPTKLEKQNIATATNEAQRRFAEKNWTLSIEAITADEDNVSHLDRFEKFSWNPYEADTPREIRDAQNERLLMIYYQQLMTYDTKPQRALAVMYARVIFQQARARNPEYDVLWEGSWDVDRHPELIEKAISSTRLSSIPWATEKMGCFNCSILVIKKIQLNGNKKSQIVNFNLEDVDDRFAKAIVKVYCRIIFKFCKSLKERGAMPIHLMLEEAHRYVQKDRDVEILGYNIFDRVAKEGRKYGVMLGLISQRPSDLSETSISQCSNFLIYFLYSAIIKTLSTVVKSTAGSIIAYLSITLLVVTISFITPI